MKQETCGNIIESVDSISKDEGGFPLTQYITNGRISLGEKKEIKVCVCVYACPPPHMNLSTALFHRRSENLRCKNICMASISHENKKHEIVLTTNN